MSEPQRLADVFEQLLSRTTISDEEAKALEAEAQRNELAALREARHQKLLRSGAPLEPKMHAAIVNGTLDLTKTKSIRTVVRWTASTTAQRLLVIQGGTGPGKTVGGGWAIANAPRGGLVRCASEVARIWSSSTNKARDEQERICNCGFFLFDDIGTEHAQHIGWMIQALRDIFESRQRAGLRTLATTNLTRAKWSARYPDERIESRLERAHWVNDDGPDLRRAVRA